MVNFSIIAALVGAAAAATELQIGVYLTSTVILTRRCGAR